jgi:hypothetical protein
MTEARNTSFVQLMLSSGLRRQEGGSLVTFEAARALARDPTRNTENYRDLGSRSDDMRDASGEIRST